MGCYHSSTRSMQRATTSYIQFLQQIENLTAPNEEVVTRIRESGRLENTDACSGGYPILDRLVKVIYLLHPTEDLSVRDSAWISKQCKSQINFAKKASLYFDQFEYANREYERFLSLIQKYPTYIIAPNIPADLVFHAHMIWNKEEYKEYCIRRFGHVVGHTTDDVPSFDRGLSKEGDMTIAHGGRLWYIMKTPTIVFYDMEDKLKRKGIPYSARPKAPPPPIPSAPVMPPAMMPPAGAFPTTSPVVEEVTTREEVEGTMARSQSSSEECGGFVVHRKHPHSGHHPSVHDKKDEHAGAGCGAGDIVVDHHPDHHHDTRHAPDDCFGGGGGGGDDGCGGGCGGD
jgi:hypothetical protein